MPLAPPGPQAGPAGGVAGGSSSEGFRSLGLKTSEGCWWKLCRCSSPGIDRPLLAGTPLGTTSRPCPQTVPGLRGAAGMERPCELGSSGEHPRIALPPGQDGIAQGRRSSVTRIVMDAASAKMQARQEQPPMSGALERADPRPRLDRACAWTAARSLAITVWSLMSSLMIRP